MKIELRKKVYPDGETWYFVDVNGVNQSSSQEESIARERYEKTKASNAFARVDILETYDTEEGK